MSEELERARQEFEAALPKMVYVSGALTQLRDFLMQFNKGRQDLPLPLRPPA